MYNDVDQGGATQVSGSGEDPATLEWSVNVTEEQTVVMQAHQLAWEYLRGTLDPEDVFVWRDGMDDWVPVGACEEIQRIVREYQAAQGGAPAAISEGPHTKKSEAQLEHDFGSTVMMDMTAHEEAEQLSQRAPVPLAEHPLAGTMVMDTSIDEVEPFGGAFVASPVGVGQSPRGQAVETPRDVSRTLASPFSRAPTAPPPPRPPAAAPSRPLPPRRPGQRDETSSLFAVDEVKNAKPKAPPAPSGQSRPPAPRAPSGPPPRNPPPTRNPPPRPPSPPSPAASVPPGVLTPAPLALAAPLAPPPSAPPLAVPVARADFAPAASVPPLAMPGAAADFAPVASVPPPPSSLNHPAVLEAQLAPKRKTSLGLIIGAAAGILLLTGGVVTFMVTRRAPAPVAQASTPTATDEAAPEAAPPTNGDAPATPTEDPTPDPAPEPSADATDPAVSENTENPDPAASAHGPASPGTSSVDGAPSNPKASGSSTSEEAPKEEPKDDAKPEFNRDAARSALNSAASSASGCKQAGGPTGRGRVTVTFAPSGQAAQASVGPPFAGTGVGGCASAAFKRASVPPFSGGPVTVSKSFFIK